MCCEAAAALQIIAMRALGCQALIDAGALEQLAVLIEVRLIDCRPSSQTSHLDDDASNRTGSVRDHAPAFSPSDCTDSAIARV